MVLITSFRLSLFRLFSPQTIQETHFSKTARSNSCQSSKCNNDQQLECKKPEPQLKDLEQRPEDARKLLMDKCKIVVRDTEDHSLISAVPPEVARTRTARIHQPTKSAAQQGTRHLGHWLIDFGTKQRWENPLMGWCSSGDPLSNMEIRFSSKEQAIDFCVKHKVSYWVQGSKTKKKFKVKSYGINFHHNARTRVSTK